MVLFAFFFLMVNVICAEPQTAQCTIDLLHEDAKRKEIVERFLSDDVPLESVSFDTGSTMKEVECKVITGWDVPVTLTVPLCQRGVEALAKKKLFKTLTLTLSTDGTYTRLLCMCEPANVVQKVIFKGSGFRKDYFFSYYDVRVGDFFSHEKHAAALLKMKDFLKKSGYLHASVNDVVTINPETYEVTIELQCDKGEKSTISQIDLSLDFPYEKFQDVLKEKIYKNYLKRLVNTSYEDELILSTLSAIEEFLKQEGYLEPECLYTYSFDEKSDSVLLNVSVSSYRKRTFSFAGNSFYSNDQLRAFLIESGNAAWLLPPSLLVQDLVIYYRKKGFWNVSIEFERHDEGVLFTIYEGPRAIIQNIVCKGLTAHLINETKLNAFFRKCIKRGYYDEDLLHQAIDRLLLFYKNQGFWDVSLTKKNYEKAEGENRYTVVLLFNQGEQRTVNKVSIQGYESLEHRGPFARVNTDAEPTPITRAEVQSQHDWLANYFRKRGHPYVRINSVFDKQKEGAFLQWTVDNVEKVHYGATIVQGRCPIAYEKILSFVDYKTGDEWKKESLIKTYTKLRSLEVFKYIGVYPDTYDPQTLTQNVVLHLQEDDPYEARIRLGFQQVSKNFAFKKGSTYKVGSTFIAKNITGNADLLRCDVDFTRFIRRIEIGYQYPNPMLLPLTVQVKGYANKYTQPLRIGSAKTLYDAYQEGFLASFGGQHKNVDYASNIGFEWMKTKNISVELSQAINFTASLIDKKVPYFFIEPTLFIDCLDDKINPTRGIYLLGALKGMVALKHDTTCFLKLMVEQGIFFPLIKHHDVICAARMRFGHIANGVFSKIMPPERFYLGGANSVRGYVTDSCPPVGTYTDDEGKVHYVPQGGKSMVNMNFEMRVPVTPAFMAVVFQDFGVLADDLEKLYDSNVASTGFGIRYLTPIGPLRFDIGFKWKRSYPEEPIYAWFLTLGNAF